MIQSRTPITPDPSLRAKKRIAALGGSKYMALLAKRRHAKLTPAERKAHALKMVAARLAKKLSEARAKD